MEASPHQARQSAEGLNEITMDEVLSRENLNAAYRKVKTNGGAPGIDRMRVEEFKEHVRKHGETLQSKLRTGEYLPAAAERWKYPRLREG
jgi:RNA-directed DNA polymerase